MIPPITFNYAIQLMQFRLVYDGPLPADNDRRSTVKPKQDIRRHIHAQLLELFRTHPALKPDSERYDELNFIPDQGSEMMIPEPMTVGKFKFEPLVREKFYMTCHLDILLLRRAKSGSIVFPGGDIDNRIKVLLDALRIPDQAGQLPSDDSPKENENPFFCLLQDDSLITGFSVRTDRLLTFKREDEGPDDIRAIIDVTVNVSKLAWYNRRYAGD